MFISKHIYLDYDDAKDIKIGEKITLVRWGNVVIDDVQPTETGIRFKGHTFLNDTDFKSTKKLTWLSKDSPLVSQLSEWILQKLWFSGRENLIFSIPGGAYFERVTNK